MVDRIWHAVYTRPGKENRVANALGKKKISTYVPVYKLEAVIEGKKKIIQGPLFPRYVFISANPDQEAVRLSRDIINYVYWQQSPVCIQHEEINAIKLFLNEYECTRLEKAPVMPATHFKINNELHLIRKGNVIEANVATVKLTLPSLGQVLVAEVRKEKVEEFTYAKESMFKNIIARS